MVQVFETKHLATRVDEANFPQIFQPTLNLHGTVLKSSSMNNTVREVPKPQISFTTTSARHHLPPTLPRPHHCNNSHTKT
ncbi:hypothetical protein M758_3G236600 [Ceratodon purpureus]|nr:hypothetical protein M758_3G236600 [Ceratodon purpureus]